MAFLLHKIAYLPLRCRVYVVKGEGCSAAMILVGGPRTNGIMTTSPSKYYTVIQWPGDKNGYLSRVIGSGRWLNKILMNK